MPHPYAHTLCSAFTSPLEAAVIAAHLLRLDRVPELFLDALFIAMRSESGREGFAYDLRWCAGLCRATWREEALWDGLVHVQRGAKKRTHLMYAAQRGVSERVRWLLTRGAPVEAADEHGDTALVWAAIQGYADIIRVLAAAGANANANTGEGQFPALYHSSSAGFVAAVRALIAAGADVNEIVLDMTTTSLQVAAANGHVRVIRELLAAGADTTPINHQNHTARELFAHYHPKLVWPAP